MHEQHKWTLDDRRQSDLDYWRTQLEGTPTALELPTDRPRPRIKSCASGIVSGALPSDLCEGLKQLGHTEAVPLATILLTAFKVLLHRYTSQDDIVVGSTALGRTCKEGASPTGAFAHTLVLRSDLSGNPTFREFLARVWQVSCDAEAHQGLPFDVLVQELAPQTDPGYSPLFQVLFVHEDRVHRHGEVCQQSDTPLEPYCEASELDLTMFSYEQSDGLRVSLQYSTDLFERATIERMLGHFRTLLEGIVANRDERIGHLPLLTEPERHQLLVEWNDTATDYPRDKCIHQLFEEQVERTPDAVAVVFEGEQLTYRELNRRANQLAHHLRELGVERETLVAICVERSLEMIVGLLGILKAGGAYVPLDPEYPKQRLAFMLEDTQAPVLLTQERMRPKLPEFSGHTVWLDGSWEMRSDYGDRNPVSQAAPNSLAYVIYTSGSTGQPKGVMIEHRGLTNYTSWAIKAYRVQEGTGSVVHSSIGFDLTVTSLYLPLLVGNTAFLLPNRDPVEVLAEAIRQQKDLSLLKITPAHIEILSASLSPEEVSSSARVLVVGGDVLRGSCTEFWSNHAPTTRIINEYGPTEAVVGSCVYEVSPRDASRSSIPIGRPIANAPHYVLDRHLQPVPIGVVGQLYISGDGLARGYLNRPDLTAEKFIDSPFGNRTCRKMYQTGDLVRWAANGNLEFIGRMDDQVKIRGFRVELGEIEATLRRHTLVNEVVLMARNDLSGETRLVAYVVPSEAGAPTLSDLRRTLAAKLPHYMIPGAFVFLTKLPLTRNGKVDRRSLPAPDSIRPDLEDSYVPPRTDFEKTVAAIWADVLGLDRVGVHDNFFDLGGHSLHAMKVSAHIRSLYGGTITPARLFQTPTIAELAETLSHGEHATSEPPSPIVPVPRSGPAALSSAQQRMWLLNRLGVGEKTYNIPFIHRIRGPLDESILEHCLQEIVRRHESLRTIFVEGPEGPLQQILPQAEVRLERTDLTDLPREQRELEAQRLTETEARCEFHFASGPLFRASLVKLAEDEHIFIFVVHHIVFDGWSEGLLYRELKELYASFSRGEASPLTELPIQYTDFAVWQREQLQGEVLESELEYWKNQLEGAPSVLELPADHTRPPQPTYFGKTISRTFPLSLLGALKKLGDEEGTTLFMTLLAVFETLLHRYTGVDDLVVGSVVANRNRREIEGLLGFFVNTIVLRTDLSANPSFRELLRRVREVTLEAYAHQDLPFERLVEELHPDRNLSQSPLFQVMFVHQNTPQEPLELPGLAVAPLEVDYDASKFDLTMFTYEQAGGLKVSIEYSTDLFEHETIERMFGHFQTLLEGIVANPDESIGRLPLLTEAERHQLLVEWNDTKTDYPRDKCIHRLFEEQVERTPDAVAVVFEGGQLTYGELNRRANQLAHHLRELGVERETLVAICVERSLEMVVGLLGILKAGGAYVPLDPEYPKQRLAFMLEDTEAPVLLTQERLRQKLPEYSGCVVCLDQMLTECDGLGDHNLPTELPSDTLAYVIYTSGSTGKPKGVTAVHRGVVRLVRNSDYVSLGPSERILQLAPLTFDASTFEIWGPLLNGGQLCVFPAGLPSMDDLGAFVRGNDITTLWLTTGLFHELADRQFDAFSGVRQLLTGGDVVSPSHAVRALNRLSGVRLVNGYGPTENTTFTCCHSMESADDVGESVSIGRPVANTQVYVLDRNLQPVPIGVPGELYTGGDGLTRGYLHASELTEEKFIANPFSAEVEDRLYRTGDQVRWQPAGTLEFLGRLDYQVKIRGFRVELSEIEAALKQHTQIKDVVVCLREDCPGAKCLVAYLVAEDGGLPAVSEVRAFLGESLPTYMLPAAFVELKKLALTPNGKIDRQNLPAPESLRSDLEDGYVAPRTEVERRLAEIWCDILGLEKVGVYDNFFELGGHSLLAVRVASRICPSLGVSFTPSQLFHTPTIAELAEILSREGDIAGEGSSGLVPVLRSGPVALSFAQQRIWLLNRLGVRGQTYNIPLAFRIEGRLDELILEHCLQEIVRRHESLRTIFVEGPEGPLQQISSQTEVRLERTELTDLPEEQREMEAQRLTETEGRREFDLASGPLFRASLLRMAEDEYIFGLVVHHIVFDGWSEGLLYRELKELYASFSRGGTSPLTELPIQYADFAVWQREQLQGEALESELAYWRNQLEGAPSVLELPADHTRPAQPTYSGKTVSRTFPLSLLGALKKLGDEEGTTLFMTLLAVFETLLHRYTGGDDLVVGSVVANRNRPEIEGLLGFFVNTIVLRTDLSENPSFRELLRRVREVTLEAYAHQDLPFERLVEELRPDRNLSQSPLFQVMFVHQNTPQESLELPGLAVAPLEVDYGASKFDLTMFTYEQAGGLKVSIEYSTDLFEHETIKRMCGHFQTLLEGIVANPDESIGRLPLLTETERHQLLVEWNDTKTDYPRDKCIHQLFEEQVERTPDAVAVVFEGEQLTYCELNRRANQLAHHLRELGVERETLVAICVERSLEMIVGLLGILKAGGAYVPLDPDYPQQRLAFMLDDTEAPVLLTQERLRQKLPAYSGRIVCLDQMLTECDGLGNHNLPTELPSDTLAYVIYTSGSTGKPKGVMVEHRNLVNLLLSMARSPGICSDDVLPAVTTICFDIAGLELFLPLIAGAKVWLTTRETALDASLLAQTLRDSRATVMQATPVTWQMLVSAGADLQGLRVLCGGEALARDLAEHFSNHTGSVFNLYGPTETTVWSAVNQVTDSATGPLIGKPIHNTQVYVLDQYRQPVPIGVPGELYIGGDGVARGYLKRAELTAERFVENPFAGMPHSRLYRTGDLVRWLSGGALEFLGRYDQQVKIRGFRIELGEIEACLRSDPAVEEAVAVVNETALGEERLVAYVVPDEDGGVTPEKLRELLRASLPHYMIPDAFVFLKRLPLTPNGKIDRQNLPAPESLRLDLEDGYVAPRTEVERRLAKLWCDVLGVERIGIDDNFFELGGHSLLAVRLASRIRSDLDFNIPVAKLFTAPTIRDLGSTCQLQFNSPLFALQPTGTRPPLVFMPSIAGSPFHHYDLLKHLERDQPVYSIQLRDELSAGEPYDSLEQMASHCADILVESCLQPPYLLAGYSFGGILAYETARQLLLRGERVSLVAVVDTGPTWQEYRILRDFVSMSWAFLKNLPYWLHANFGGLCLTRVASRFFSKARSYAGVVRRRTKSNLEEALVEEFEATFGMPLEEVPEHYRDLYLSHFRAFLNYTAKPISTDITLFRARIQMLSTSFLWDFGWNRLCRRLEVVPVPGDHGSVMKEPNCAVLAERMTESLNRVAAKYGGSRTPQPEPSIE
ncbi:MAG: amino acid adenylation domain-containing protein [Planctomycetaceae bacterium]|nr:amino acid adenylation domain-containing protein [Planctomycetaceae bacterium]